MKILVFNGSPKKEKSDTMHITRAFLDGMKEAAAQKIHTIDVIDRHIGFCRGCFACKYNGWHCVIDDDMREIPDEMLGSDLLLFSYPLYCYGMPAMLKNLIDRTLPLSSMAMAESGGRYVHVGGRDCSHLRYLMICGCGFPNSKNNFEAAVQQFELLFPSARGGCCDRPETGAGSESRAAVREKRRDRRGTSCRDRLSHDTGGNLRPDRKRKCLKASPAFGNYIQRK